MNYSSSNAGEFSSKHDIYYKGTVDNPRMVVADVPGGCAYDSGNWIKADGQEGENIVSKILGNGKPVQAIMNKGKVEGYILQPKSISRDYFAEFSNQGRNCTYEVGYYTDKPHTPDFTPQRRDGDRRDVTPPSAPTAPGSPGSRGGRDGYRNR